MSRVSSGKMTDGNAFKLIVIFSLPLIAGSILQQFYNMADSIIVGQFVGETALVAVNGAFPIIFLMSSLFMGLGTGSTVMVSQFFGANDLKNLQNTVNTTYTGLIAGGIPLSIASILLANPILNLLNVPQDARDESYVYLVIVLAGLVGSLGYNVNTGILQGLGDSRTPLILLAIACLLDNALNLLFVLVFNMGVAGAALSTIIGQFSSWIFGIIYINKKYPMIQIRPFSFKFDQSIFGKIIKLGLPAGIQFSLFSLASMFLLRLVNQQGTSYAAGFGSANKLDTFAFLPIQSFSIATTTFTGQNIGAGKTERVRKGMQATLILSIGFSLLSILVIPAGPTLMRMFTDSPAVIESGMIYLRSIMPFYSLLAVLFIINSVIRGSGESIIPMISILIGICIIRLPAAYALEYYFGREFIYYSYPIGWLTSICVTVPYYLSGRWKNKSVTKSSEGLQAVDMSDPII